MYSIIRLYKDGNHPDHNKIIATGLTLEEAQKHCNDPSTCEENVWFDGYREENRPAKSNHTATASMAIGLLRTKGDILHRTRE
jgi:hypothetical protein